MNSKILSKTGKELPVVFPRMGIDAMSMDLPHLPEVIRITIIGASMDGGIIVLLQEVIKTQIHNAVKIQVLTRGSPYIAHLSFYGRECDVCLLIF